MPSAKSWRLATPQENAEAEESLYKSRIAALAEWKRELKAVRATVDKLLDQIEEFKLVLA